MDGLLVTYLGVRGEIPGTDSLATKFYHLHILHSCDHIVMVMRHQTATLAGGLNAGHEGTTAQQDWQRIIQHSRYSLQYTVSVITFVYSIL